MVFEILIWIVLEISQDPIRKAAKSVKNSR